MNLAPVRGSYLDRYCGASPANDMRPFQGQSPPLLAAQQFVNSLNSLLRRLRPTSKCGAAPQLRRKNSINSNLRRPRCPKPRFQPPKIAKRLVRNCRAKKCCNFSLKCLDVNNLIHNFAPMVKIGCTSAKLTSKLAISALGLHYLCLPSQDRLHLGKAYKQASSFALGLHYLCHDTPTERRRTNCISAVAEPIKTPNNEIFCPHNALHALPFSKASFRVC